MEEHEVDRGSEVGELHPDQRDEENQWGTVEWTSHWGDELDTIMESFSGDIARLEKSRFYSVTVMMRELDPPDNRSVPELIGAEKRELVQRVRDWLGRYPDIDAEVIVNRGGVESVAQWGERISSSELVDIRFSPKENTPEPPQKEKKEIIKKLTMVGACGFCHHRFEEQATIRYRSGEQHGEITIGDQTQKSTYDRGFGWGVTVECVCTTDIDKANPGKHRKVTLRSRR